MNSRLIELIRRAQPKRVSLALLAIVCLLLPQAAKSADGDHDHSFGTAGKTVTDFNGSDRVQAAAVAIQVDGKIVVGGKAPGSGTDDFALARYTTAGALDTSFGSGTGT